MNCNCLKLKERLARNITKSSDPLFTNQSKSLRCSNHVFNHVLTDDEQTSLNSLMKKSCARSFCFANVRTSVSFADLFSCCVCCCVLFLGEGRLWRPQGLDVLIWSHVYFWSQNMSAGPKVLHVFC